MGIRLNYRHGAGMVGSLTVRGHAGRICWLLESGKQEKGRNQRWLLSFGIEQLGDGGVIYWDGKGFL